MKRSVFLVLLMLASICIFAQEAASTEIAVMNANTISVVSETLTAIQTQFKYLKWFVAISFTLNILMMLYVVSLFKNRKTNKIPC